MDHIYIFEMIYNTLIKYDYVQNLIDEHYDSQLLGVQISTKLFGFLFKRFSSQQR